MFFTSFMALVLLCLKGSLIYFFFALGTCLAVIVSEDTSWWFFSSSARPFFVVVFFVLFCFFFQLSTLHAKVRSNSKLGQVSAGPSSTSIRDHFRTEELCNQTISYRLGLPSTLSSFSIDSCLLTPDKILAACNCSGLINTGLGFFSVFIQRSSCRRLQLSAPS